MNAPSFRVWLVVLIMCMAGILTIRFFQIGNVPLALLTLLLLVSNGVRLWNLTRKGR